MSGTAPVVFVVSAASSFRLLRLVAAHVAAAGRRVAFLYERGDDAMLAMIRREAAALGGDAYAFETFIDSGRRPGPVWNRHPRTSHAMRLWLQVQLRRMGGGAAIARVNELRAILAAQLAAARHLLSQLRPSAVVAGEDGISAPLAIHAAARHAGIPVVVVPFGYGVRRDLEAALDGKAARGELVTATGTWAPLIRAHAPQWINTGPHAGALMYEEAYIVAAESLGITLRDPWIIHGGYAERLCVESEQMKRAYLDEGIPDEKLALTGTPYCDVMLQAVSRNPAAQSALRQPRRITAGRTRILVSWPPSYHDERGRFSEFPSYREMSLAILGWLNRLPNVELTVSLHPATLDADRAALVDIGTPLTDEYVIELIPQHDVLVTYFSSTIRWAIAAGKPVLNFDLYKWGVQVYAAAPGVTTVDSVAAFQQAIGDLVSSDAGFAAAAERQIAVAGEWGVLDGQCTARIGAEIDRVAAAH